MYVVVVVCQYNMSWSCMYLCMVITYSKGMDQPGKVANPARGQLNSEQGKLIFPCPRSRLKIWSRKTGSAVPPRVSLLIWMDQPGKVANPARGQLNSEQGKLIFPCPRLRLKIWSRKTGSAVPPRVSLPISIIRLKLVLTYGIPPDFRGGVH